MLIQVENLTHTYAPGTPLESTALKGVSLEIAPGERVGIAGHTGSGKSTLVQHLAGLLTPTDGQVRLDGTPAHERSRPARDRRRRIGIAFQYPEDQVFEQTVFQEVAFGPHNQGLDKSEIAERVHWALEMVRLEPSKVMERVPFTLSGGEMRRVALASILALHPEVLILDEPTAGLDPRGRRELLSRMQAWQERANATHILVSHDLDALARTVERVVVLKGGQVLADDHTRRVLSDGNLLQTAGLDVPQPVALLRMLREAGWEVRTDGLLPEEAADEIMQAMQRGRL